MSKHERENARDFEFVTTKLTKEAFPFPRWEQKRPNGSRVYSYSRQETHWRGYDSPSTVIFTPASTGFLFLLEIMTTQSPVRLARYSMLAFLTAVRDRSGVYVL